MKRNHLQRSFDFKEQRADSAGMKQEYFPTQCKKNQTRGNAIAQNGLQAFDFDGQQTRIIMKDGVPWWVAKDVCDILGYINSRKAIEDHCKHKETFGVTIRDTGKGSVQQMVIIPESDVYRLIIRSNMPEAVRFETWLMEEVLPSIRKYGAYMMPQKIEEATLNPEMITPLIQALKNEQDALKAAEEKIAALEKQNEQNQLKLSYGQTVQDSLERHETILHGKFTKTRYLGEEGLLLVWLAPGESPRGIARPSTAQNYILAGWKDNGVYEHGVLELTAVSDDR